MLLRPLVVLAILCLGMPAMAQCGSWTILPGQGTPRQPHAASCYAAADQAAYFFGGVRWNLPTGGPVQGIPQGQTLRYSEVTQSLVALTPVNQPQARFDHAMAHDLARGISVMFGGTTGPGQIFGDTWEFDGTNWQQVAPLLSPSPRRNFSMSYDPVLQRVILFGGRTAPGQRSAETWSYDGVTWTLESTQGPTPREGHAMAYDAQRGVHVIFGGFTSNFVYTDETWEYDATQNTWSQVPLLVSPAARGRHAMAWDERQGKVLLLGGRDVVTEFAEHWAFDGNSWVGPCPIPTTTLALDGNSYFDASFVSLPGEGRLLFGPGLSFGPQLGSYRDSKRWHFYESPFPTPYTGTGSDALIEVRQQGSPATAVGQVPVYPLQVGADFSFRLYSPGGTLAGSTFALISSVYATGSPPTGLSLIGGGPADVWIDPMAAVILLDSLFQTFTLATPTLSAAGLNYGPFLVPAAASGLSVNLQIFAEDLAAPPLNLSVSDAVTLEIL